MMIVARALLLLTGSTLIGNSCHAQILKFTWSEWETTAVERRGPDLAQGLLLFFHGRSERDVTGWPIPVLFAEMARIAKWDILRINRLPFFDQEPDDDILQIVADRVTQARQDGYKRVIVAGQSRGGWLALQAATLPGVDAAIGLAPGTGIKTRAELERTRALLAERLAHTKGKRIAAFFFEGDWDVSEGRAEAIRRGLQRSGSTFMVVDRPPDLPGHAAMGTGRFVRRYRDCLLQFVEDTTTPGGEVQCSRSTGHAVGSEIGLPASSTPLLPPPAMNPVLLGYWGRWEGDDDRGGYLILDAVDGGPGFITFRMGYSTGSATTLPGIWIRDVSYRLDEGNGRIVSRHPTSLDTWAARIGANAELRFEVEQRWRKGEASIHEIILHKRLDEESPR